jgi:PAS domain S-box-containing protein
MADASPQIIWLLDATGQLTYVNQRALEFTQKTYEEIQEQGWVSEAIHPDDRLRVQEVFRQALQAKTFLQLEYRCRCAQGDYRWLYSVGNPCLSLQGELLGFIGSTLDITELKEAQKSLEAYARQLELSNKELEQFAFVASHDLQEPLRKVRVFAECLKQAEDCHLTPKAYDYLERMRGAAQRMQDLITGLLDLSRLNRRSQSFQTVDLNRVLTEVLGELQEYIQAVNGCVRVENLPYIKADPGQMHQLFLNLLSNALKFHRPGVPPVVTVAFEWEDGDWGRVRVEDNGIGFEPKYSEQIFDIFERLHGRGQYEGTGIGLAICKKIVERHDGTITATSTLGQGSDFTVTLPHCSKVMPEIAILS